MKFFIRSPIAPTMVSSPAQARRVIFLTGDVVNEDTLGFLKSTGNPHIAKPFNLSSVRKTVAEVIDSYRSPATVMA